MINGQHTQGGGLDKLGQPADVFYLPLDTFYLWTVELDNFEHLFWSGVRLTNHITHKLIDCL